MSGSPDPVEAPYNDRSASEIIAFEKLHARLTVADATEVRNTDLSARFGGVFVRSTNRNYRIDTGSTAADDGVECIIDSAGTHFLPDAGTGSTQIDFGSGGAADSAVTIDTVPGIQAGATVHAWITAQDSDDRDSDEHWADPPLITAGTVVAEEGFTIYATGRTPGHRPRGAWTVNYSWNNN